MDLVDRFIHRYSRLPTEFDPDYLEMLRMSKYRILAVPDVQPGKCINCGASKNDGRGYIDIGLQVDWFGAAIFCSLCIGDIAKNLGLFNTYEAKISQLEEQLKTISLNIKQAGDLEDKFLSIFMEVKEYLGDLRPAGDDSNSDSAVDVGADKTATESGAKDSDSATKGRKAGTTESSSSSGSKNVRSLADLLSE